MSFMDTADAPSNTQSYVLWILLEGDEEPVKYNFNFGPDIQDPNLNDLKAKLPPLVDELKNVKPKDIHFFHFDARIHPILPDALLQNIQADNAARNPLVV
ncbi:1855_t:CDS:1, partial [Paraglomus occultum]